MHMKHILWYLIAGTRGGETRGRIIMAIKKRPRNTHKLCRALDLDYKTVQHHLEILEKHDIVFKRGDYGAVYFLTEAMEHDYNIFDEIWEQLG